MDIMIPIEIRKIIDNNKAWMEYSKEYYAKADFSEELIHTGLGLVGLEPSAIIKSSNTILDIGCGNGKNTYLLSRCVDGLVFGIDPVEEQINKANATYGNSKLQFICSDYQGISGYIQNQFELVTFFGSLDYICLENSFFRLLNTLTRSRSRCYIVKFHPFWTTLFGNDVGCEIEGTYFDVARGDCVTFGNTQFTRFHYSISELFARFKAYDWTLTDIFEPEPDIDHSAFAYLGYENDAVLQTRMSKFPMTIILEFERL